MKKKITEKDKVHDQWYELAKEQTLETLPEFLRHLTEDFEHDYGTICHAISAGAVAAAWAMEHTPQGGISGFQAGFIIWGFIRGWRGEDPVGRKLVNYSDMLYPQYEHKFSKTIEKGIMDLLIKQAEKALKENKSMAPSMRSHMESIAAGAPPFGYSVVPDE